MPSVSDLARDLHDLAVPMIINHIFVHIVFVLLMGVKRGGRVGVNGVMEVALCARWVLWPPMSPCARSAAGQVTATTWPGIGPVVPTIVQLTGGVVSGTVAGGCAETGTVAGAA